MKTIRWFLLPLLAVVFWVPNVGTQEPPPLRVHFVDVGQGDGVLIESPSGQNVVYDAGEDPSRMREYLESLGVPKVDLAIASHNHADHIGGLVEVLRRFPPPFYMDNGVPTTTQVYGRVLSAVRDAGSQLMEPTQRRIQLGDASLVIVPPPGIASWDQNDNSIGMVVEYGEFRLSVAGDAEPREWAWWLVNHPGLIGKVHVHKASHHGSVNGDTAGALGRLRPEKVVISAGVDNQYGHPDAQALRLYEERGATAYRTDQSGTVVIEAQPSGAYTVHVERGEGAQPPPSPAPGRTTWRLSGTVRASAGNALLSGVSVGVADGPNANRSTVTDTNGAFSLSGLEQSGFTVRFSKSGYDTVSRGVTLIDNITLNVSLSAPAPRPTPTPTPSPSPAPSPSPSPAPSPAPTPSPSPSPSPAPSPGQRVGATCKDGTSSNATGSGACSSHGGVRCWRYSDGSCRAS